MPTENRTYVPILSLPEKQRVFGKCSFTLPNNMQCWRSGDQIVTHTRVLPATADAPEREEVLTYQYCDRHVLIQKGIDNGSLDAKTVAGQQTPPVEAPVEVVEEPAAAPESVVGEPGVEGTAGVEEPKPEEPAAPSPDPEVPAVSAPTKTPVAPKKP
jgi:hypothetical protein